MLQVKEVREIGVMAHNKPVSRLRVQVSVILHLMLWWLFYTIYHVIASSNVLRSKQH